MSYEIVTDSSSNLTREYIESVGLHILALTLIADGEETYSYLKDEDIDLQKFYTMMREGKVITTSLPNLKDTEIAFRSILDAGKDVIYLGFSSGLSGTYEALTLLLKDLAKEYPDRTLYSVDTLAASGGQGLLVLYAIQKAKEGMTIHELKQWVEDNRNHLAHWFTVDDLMFLFRGGRVSKSSAWAGTMLNIKPVMHVDDEGHLIPMEKVRGRKKSLNALIDHMRKTAIQPISDQTIFITHGDCIEDAQYIEEKIREEFGVKDVIINYIDPVIGAHSGPGTVALFFMADHK